MADIVTSSVRSRMMASIRGKDTKPEVLLRKLLFARGFRYLLHDQRLPGRPDLVFPKYGAIIQVHGCFWHGHECSSFRWPASRSEFWHGKIAGNRARDQRNLTQLQEAGWRVLTVWECAVRGARRRQPDTLADDCAKWLKSRSRARVIASKHPQEPIG